MVEVKMVEVKMEEVKMVEAEMAEVEAEVETEVEMMEVEVVVKTMMTKMMKTTIPLMMKSRNTSQASTFTRHPKVRPHSATRATPRKNVEMRILIGDFKVLQPRSSGPRSRGSLDPLHLKGL